MLSEVLDRSRLRLTNYYAPLLRVAGRPLKGSVTMTT